MNEPAIRAIGPRPLDYIRIRLHGGGQAVYVRDLLIEEKEALFDDLGRMRDEGKGENSLEVQEVRAQLEYLIRALRDIESGMVELVGTERSAHGG